MNKLVLWLAMMGISSIMWGQTITVKDKLTQMPVEQASIQSNGQTFKTDKQGKADVSSVAASDTLKVTAIGYQPVSYTLQTLAGMNYRIELRELPYAIDEVVVSASKFEEKKSDVPQQIMILNSREMQFMNQQTTADLLQNSGNVFVQKSQQGGGSPVLRGFEANKVLIVVDGVRMNNAIFRGGHLQNIITLDNSIIDRTEVVFGPGSVVYGSDALGGVMHFYTRKPLLAYGTKPNIKIGAYTRYSTASNEKTGHVNLNFGWQKIGFLSGVTVSDFGDMRQGNIRNPFYGNWGKREFYAERINGQDSMVANNDVNIQKQSGYRQIDVFQKILFKQGKATHLLNVQYSTSSDINRYDRLTEISAGKLRFAQWYYGPQKRLLTSYQFSLDAPNKFFTKWNAIAAYQDIEESRHDRRFNNTNLNHRIENVKVYSFNTDFEKDLGKHELRYGGEFTFNKVTSSANQENIVTGETKPLDTRYPDGGSDMQTIAIYATHSWEITDKLVLSEGLRYSSIGLNAKFVDTSFFPFPFNSVNQQSSALNGNIGFTYAPEKSWLFSVIVSTGFRAPNVDDLTKVFDSKPGTVVVPNPNLKPEYLYNGELSITKIIMNKVKLDGTAFYAKYVDALTVRNGTFNSQDSMVYSGVKSAVQTPVNAAEAYLYGGSFSVIADISNTVSISSSLTYTYGRIKTDSTDYPLDHIPPMYGRTGLNVKIKKFRGELFALYNGWKTLADYNMGGEDNQQYATIHGTPSWYTINLRMAYYMTYNLQIQVALDNILDANYRVFASGISSPGRNLVLTLRGNF